MLTKPSRAIGAALIAFGLAASVILACHPSSQAPKFGAAGGGNAVLKLDQVTFLGTFNGDAAIPHAFVGPDVIVESSSHTYQNQCNGPVSVAYNMVGGGGGAGGCTLAAGCKSGSGGAASGVVVNGAVVASAIGGTGGAGGKVVSKGVNGSASTGSLTVLAGQSFTVYTAGGGGGGGYTYGGGGGAGIYGGGGGGGTDAGGPGGAGDAGGSNGGGGTAGSLFLGGAGAGAHPGAGGTAGLGGYVGASASHDQGGGGGGYGGAGGAATDNSGGAFAATPGGSNGGNSSSVVIDGGVTIPGALGALTWVVPSTAFSTTLPTAAGQGGQSLGQGGNAGLVVLTYTPPAGVPCLTATQPRADYCASGADGGACTVVQSLPGGGAATLFQITTVDTSVTLDGGVVNSQVCQYVGEVLVKDSGVPSTMKTPAALVACGFSDAGPGGDGGFATPTFVVQDGGALTTAMHCSHGRLVNCTHKVQTDFKGTP